MSDFQANDSVCVVCFKNVLYYSIGECDHPVCYECSTRMRVLCLQNECPICRQDLSRVVFTDSIQPYKELRNNVFPDKLFERQFKIGFCSEEIKNAYERLLENRCKLCNNIPPFRSFSSLSDHMRKIHERFYCDLCVKHLKIFTFERKCYTRQELAHHRRKGDLDDTSHRGHPLCEFCEERFMDADELYRHLRKEHLYCHLCDADGSNQYYATHNALAHHFRTEHYLCEEGECAGQHLTAVFRTEIDLKAHKASVHGRGLARAAARQARTLELQFNITPHQVVQRVPRENINNENEALANATPVMATAQINTESVEQFPRLSSAPASTPLLLSGPARHYKAADTLKRDDKNFPALDGSAVRQQPTGVDPAPRPPPTVAATLLRNSKPSVSIQLHSQPASASNFRLTQASGARISILPQQKRGQLSDDDFPSLAMPKDDHPSLGAATVQPSKVTLINSEEMQSIKNNNKAQVTKKPALSCDAFPALSSNAVPSAPPQWITISKSKEKVKQTKTDPPPQQRDKTFNPIADFPELPINHSSKGKSKKVAPSPFQYNNQTEHLIKSKKATPSPFQHNNQNEHLIKSKKATPSPIQHINQNEHTVKSNGNKKEKKMLNNKVKMENDYDVINNINVDKIDKKSYKDSSASILVSNINNNKECANIERKIQTITETAGVTGSARKDGKSHFAMSPSDYPPLNPKCEALGKSNSGILAESFKSKIVNGPPANSAPTGLKPRPACDGMTFTNSSGQTFPAPLHTYIQPPNFENRNHALVKKFVAALGSTEAVEEFKMASRAFRDNAMSADEFWRHCEEALAGDADEVLPELVALLPDIGKQQELAVGRDVLARLRVCAVCGQLLAPADAAAHDAAHWPPLAAAR